MKGVTFVDLLWADLLNSDWHDHLGTGAREDRIGKNEWLHEFLEKTCWASDHLPSAHEREALRHLRNLLGRIIHTYRQDGTVSKDHVKSLNRILEDAPVIRRMDGSGGISVLPTARGIAPVLGEIVASLASMLARGEHTRVKVCANPDCGWIIYDESRNQTRRWCSATDCGNVLKVRKHRQRARKERV
jgi:predicted RNA-binding Zn ribbon-like protein